MSAVKLVTRSQPQSIHYKKSKDHNCEQNILSNKLFQILNLNFVPTDLSLGLVISLAYFCNNLDMIDSNKMVITTQDSKLDMPSGNHFIFLCVGSFL